MKYFNEDRRAYYRAKRLELSRKKEEESVIKQDALYIYHYGMDAFLTLFPDAKDMGISWHEKIVEELEAIENRKLGRLVSGFYSASAATKDKGAFRRFKALIKDMTRK